MLLYCLTSSWDIIGNPEQQELLAKTKTIPWRKLVKIGRDCQREKKSTTRWGHSPGHSTAQEDNQGKGDNAKIYSVDNTLPRC